MSPSVPCGWCGRPLVASGVGRPRRYCAQSCRQRAYEQRRVLDRHGLPLDALVLSADEATDLVDRLYQLRCAAEDLTTAVAEQATPAELTQLSTELTRAAQSLERLRPTLPSQ